MLKVQPFMHVLTDLPSLADDVLRGRVGQHDMARPRGSTRRQMLRLGLILVVAGATYGALMGCSGGVGGERKWQLLYSAIKVPMLLGVTFVVALPSFFVLNTLLGVRGDFRAVLRALTEAQAGLTVVLASLAPFTLVWYASVASYPAAILFNAAMFGLASLAGQRLLRRAYAPLIARDPVHRLLLRAWLVLYAFVGIQMGWTLRPFIGAPEQPVRFFRSGVWGNAYVEVMNIVLSLVR